MNFDNLSVDNWKAAEQEYFDTVIKKNEFFSGQELLTHYFTADNTEMLLVKTFDSWYAIEKARIKEEELIKSFWTYEKLRTAFFNKRQAYYAPNHSDEIYNIMLGQKWQKKKWINRCYFMFEKFILRIQKMKLTKNLLNYGISIWML